MSFDLALFEPSPPFRSARAPFYLLLEAPGGGSIALTGTALRGEPPRAVRVWPKPDLRPGRRYWVPAMAAAHPDYHERVGVPWYFNPRYDRVRVTYERAVARSAELLATGAPAGRANAVAWGYEGPPLRADEPVDRPSAFRGLLLAESPAAGLRDAMLGWLGDWIPELRELDTPQRTRWHDRSVLEHSLAVVEALPPVLEERVAGLLHDIGKRRRRSVDERGEEHYYGHDIESAQMAGAILRRAELGIDPGIVTEMIRLHMAFHDALANRIRSDRAVRALSERLGPHFDRVARLSLADSGAMAPEMVGLRLEPERELIGWLREHPARRR